MKKRFQIFETRTSKAGFDALALLSREAEKWFFDEVELDFSGCGWFDANMAGPLGCVLSQIIDHLNSIEIVGLPLPVRAILSKNRFLENYGGSKFAGEHDTVVPFRRFDLEDGRYFAAYASGHIRGKGLPAMSIALQRKFFESLGELFENAVMHSESRLGVFACGQFYPNKRRFDFCLCDAGAGFEGSIARAFDLRVDSLKAMRFCLGEGNTTKRDQPGGLGLKLLKRFIKLNKGRIVIVSYSGYYEFVDGVDRYENLSHSFPGTCINIEINTADSCSYQLNNETTSDSTKP